MKPIVAVSLVVASALVAGATSAQELEPRKAEARVSFSADSMDTSVFVQSPTRSDRLSFLCTAPCASSLPLGNHVLALSSGAGRPMVAATSTRVLDGAKLWATYESKSDVRTAGWMSAGVGSVVGLTLMGLGAVSLIDAADSGGGETHGAALLAVGSVVAAAGIIVGSVLLHTPDRASFAPDVPDTPVPPEQAGGTPATPSSKACEEIEIYRARVAAAKDGPSAEPLARILHRKEEECQASRGPKRP